MIRYLYLSAIFFSSVVFIFQSEALKLSQYITSENYKIDVDWNRYNLNIKGFIPMDEEMVGLERKQLRTNTKEKILSQATSFFEDFNVDSDNKIRDLLKVNRTFSMEYSLFLEDLRISSLFFKHNGIETNMSIPLRGERGLLKRIPLPWGEEEYNILKEEQYIGEGYSQKKANGEFFRSLAPVNYSGLLVNASDLNVKKALAPRIYSQDGRLIYGPEFISRVAGTQRGIVSYVSSFNDREVLNRLGKNYLLTSALATRGKFRTDLVISLEDTARLFDSSISATNLLKCRVVILTSAGSANP